MRVEKVEAELLSSLCFDGLAGCGWRNGIRFGGCCHHCVLMGWQGVGGEAVFSV